MNSKSKLIVVFIMLIFVTLVTYYGFFTNKGQNEEMVFIHEQFYSDVLTLTSIQNEVIISALDENNTSSTTLQTSLRFLTDLQKNMIHDFDTHHEYHGQVNKELITELYTLIGHQEYFSSASIFSELDSHHFENLSNNLSNLVGERFDIIHEYKDPAYRIEQYIISIRKINKEIEEIKLWLLLFK